MDKPSKVYYVGESGSSLLQGDQEEINRQLFAILNSIYDGI